MARRERRPRQKTYPGPNLEDNQQMLQDIKNSIAVDTQSSGTSTSTITSEKVASLLAGEEMRTERPLERERPESRGDREQAGSRNRERRSPPGLGDQASSPGTTARSQQNRSTPTKQLSQNSDRNKKQLREIRKSLRPWVRSDPGFHAASSKDQVVNVSMLEQLISLGHSENSAAGALIAVNNFSVEAALDFLQKRERLVAIQEDESRRVSTLLSSPSDHSASSSSNNNSSGSGSTGNTTGSSRTQRRKSPEKSVTPVSSSGTPTSQQRTTESSSAYDIVGTRISPIQLPGFKTPVTFDMSDLPPTLPDHQLMQQMSSTVIRRPQPIHLDPSSIAIDDDREGHSDSSPTRNSPPYIHSSPPPYGQNGAAHEDKTHIHISPPPEVHPHSYSPFSAPFSSRREMMPGYDRSAAFPVKGYGGSSARVTPSNEFSDSGIEEETTPRRTPVPPEAFKFFMEQHIENIFKSYHQRMQRRLKLEQEMAKRGLDEPTSEQMRRILYQKESNFLRIKRAKMHKDMFKTVKPLGIGAFGVVSLVRKVDTNKLYAMKTLRKVDVLRRNQVAHVKAERDILAEADNEWVVKLFFSFQDSENLYFVMEYIPGGDMMSLLIKLGTFPEHLTLFYVAELVCAIESVHKMGFIHRDIKPDNILIGSDGHIKLTDFGLCTGFRWTHDSKRYLPKGHHQRHHSMEPGQWDDEEPVKPLEVRRIQEHDRSIAHSLVGTPNYIAPEILRRVGYKQLCDWWSVGVIMYEMIVGQPPFMAPTPSETQHKIMNWSQYIHVPQHAIMSRAAADLILRFCCDPADRIGKNGTIEIKSHPFFSAIDWSVGIRNYEPPYVPKIMYDADTSNFDPIPQSQLQKLQSKKQTEVSSLPKGQPEHAFYEWTFIRFYPEKGVGQKRPTITPSSVYTGNPPSSSSSSSTPGPTPSAAQHASAYSPPPPPPPAGYERGRRPTERPAPPPTSTNTAASPSPNPGTSRDRRKPTPQPVYV